MRRVYEMLLRLYPADHRALFAYEMLAVFEEAAGDRRGCGRLAFLRFVFTELLALVTGALTEWVAKLGGRHLPENAAGRGGTPDEMLEAQQRLKITLARMEYAIAHHQFQKARFYSEEERKERAALRLLGKKHEIAE
jgi:hypothetical protein